MKGHRKGSRSQARERALQALYQVDLASAEPSDALANAWKSEDEGVPEQPDAETLKFSDDLVHGVCSCRAELDQKIEEASRNWRVDRMAKVDRNVLRLAVYELTRCPGTPRKVILNEAVELAKKFGSEESGAFINGILDKIAHSLPAETK